MSTGVLTALLTIGAALAFGASVAMQHGVVSGMSQQEASGVGLLVRAARRPLWLAGFVVSFLGFALHAAAVKSGALLVVQPLLGASVVFGLLFVAASTGDWLSRNEWLAVGAVVLSLGAFLAAVGLDRETRAVGEASLWLATAALTLVWVLPLVASALRTDGKGRAWRLGLAAGVANGYVAVLTKAFAERAADGPAALLRGWPLYALAVAGLPALLLVQAVYRAGHLRVSLPIITVVDPIVAVAVEWAVFRNHVTLTPGRAAVATGAGLFAGAALWSLARNPRITRLEAHA